MTTESVPAIKSILRQIPPFSGLDDTLLSWLSEQAQPFHCDAGQLILSPDRIPETFYCLVEGKGRLLFNDPTVKRPVTLAHSFPGDLIGWVGLARRHPCEWVTASTNLRLIGFPASVFYELEERSQHFRAWLDSSNSPSELMSVLSSSFNDRPSGSYSCRDILKMLVPNMNLIPARSARVFEFDASKYYLWNVVPPASNIQIGSFVDPAILADILRSFSTYFLC